MAAETRRRSYGLVLALCLLPVLGLAGCAQQYASYSAAPGAQPLAPTQYYPPPGPQDDPWGPYINEAAARYNIPAQWIRAVMAQESGGEEQAVSPVGAMGLMQLMPGTYAALREENGLGADPFNPQDNILAGAAYISEMYARYGSPGFLAAYNAGPQAVDDYLAGQSQLPLETTNYLAAVTPNLGTALPLSGPLADYAVASTAGGTGAPTNVSFATGCDVNAAYDPDHPCTAAAANIIASAAQSPAGSCDLNAAYDADNPCTPASGNQLAANAGACDLDRAYDPDSPCAPAPAVAAPPPAPPPASGSLLYQPAGSASVPAPPAPAMAAVAPAGGAWAIQVGAFSSMGLARAVAEGARAEMPGALAAAVVELPATAPFGSLVLYRARLANLSQQSAANACAKLNAQQLPCIVVPASAA